MALHNLARMLVTVGGTGPITLGNAASTFNDLATAGVGNGETVTYAIEDLLLGAREIGRGSYNTSTKVFTRSTVLASTNGGNPINCTTQAQLFVTVAAEDIAPLPDLVGTNGQLIVGQTGGQAAWKTVNGDLTLSAAGLATIVNITTGATMAGDLVATNSVAPATPSAGSTALYVDSTNKVLSSKNDAGTVSNTVVPSTASAHQFATAVSASGVVTYTQPAATDISSGAALTTANDTNVTLTAGGSAASALLAASSITAGWTGTLAAGRLNANVVQGVTNDTNVTGTISAQNLTLGWTGTLAVARGGLGVGTLAAHGILLGEGTSAVTATAAMTSGQLLIGQGATADPLPETMSGDATITNLGAITIASNAVTNAKMATVANQTIKSNISGGTATPSDNTLTAILDNILGSSQGDIIYRGASSWTVLAPGTNGNVLTTGGAAANPSWSPAGSGVTSVATGWGLTGGTITTTGTLSVATSNPPYGFNQPINLQLNATVGSNLLTIALKGNNGSDPSATNPVLIPFRDVTIANGDPAWVAVTAALSISTNATGATLGTANTVPFRLWIVAFNNAGTAVLALWQSVTGGGSPTAIAPLNEAVLQSTTGISASATSAGTFYTPNGTALTSKAFRILGYVDYASGLTTAGTYASAPTTVQLFGPGVNKPGNVVQAVYSTESTAETTASTTYVASTNGRISITPSATSNIIVARFSGVISNNTSAANTFTRWSRGTTNATNLFGNEAQMSNMAGSGTFEATATNFGYDAPGTTSSTTYAVQFRASSGTAGLCTGTTAAAFDLQELMV